MRFSLSIGQVLAIVSCVCLAVSVDAKKPKSKSVDPFSESNLLSSNDQQMINRWIGDPRQLWRRCYASSVDGPSGDAFAELCAHRGPSVVIIQFDNGKISGGYTDVSWTKIHASSAISSRVFLFSVTHGKRFPIVRPQSAIQDTHTPDFDRYGPRFGSGDLGVDPNMTTGGCAFPSTFAWQGHSSPNPGPSDGRAEISAAREELCGQDSLDTIIIEVEVFLYPEYM